MLICKYQNKPIFIRIKGDIGDIDSNQLKAIF